MKDQVPVRRVLITRRRITDETRDPRGYLAPDTQ